MKILNKLFCVFLCINILLGFSFNVNAVYGLDIFADESRGEETENNDSIAYPDYLSLNLHQKVYVKASIENDLGGYEDVDYYRLHLKDNYSLHMRFSPRIIDYGTVWYFQILDEQRNEMVLYEITPRNLMNVIPYMNLNAGYYYIAVWSDQVSNVEPYEIFFWCNNFVESACEPNNDESSATEMIFGENYYGAITSENDYEYFKFNLEKDSIVQIDFEHDRIIDSYDKYWKIDVFNNKNKLIHSKIVVAKDPELITTELDLSAGEYYVVISPADDCIPVRYDLTVSASEKPHIHNYQKNVVGNSCLTQGYTEYKCDCGDSYVSDYVEATGHNYEKNIIKPTCTEKGYTEYKCSCGNSYISDNVEATGHNYEKNIIKPTCTEKGYTEYKCSCGNSYVSDNVEATGHDYDKKVTEPTCTDKGYTTYVCNCGYEYIADYVPENGHYYAIDVIPATCINAGFSIYTCICGKEFISDVVPTVDHEYCFVKTVNSTCTEKGYNEYVCSTCNDVKQDDYIPPTGHKSKWITILPADIGVEGLEKLFCEVCGIIIQERVIPAKKNEYKKGDVNNDGEITAADARLALRFSAEIDKPDNYQFLCADIDMNDTVTASDARKILRVAAGLEDFDNNNRPTVSEADFEKLKKSLLDTGCMTFNYKYHDAVYVIEHVLFNGYYPTGYNFYIDDYLYLQYLQRDPVGWFDWYYVYDAETVKWICEEIYHVDCKEQSYQSINSYFYDGELYIRSGGPTDSEGETWLVVEEYTINTEGKYEIILSKHYNDIESNYSYCGKLFVVADLQQIHGESFWTFYSVEKM